MWSVIVLFSKGFGNWIDIKESVVIFDINIVCIIVFVGVV